jgi:tRNA-modifying protein YgfZ
LLAHIDCTEEPQAGNSIQMAGQTEAIGEIVRAAPAPEGGFDTLVEIRLESMEEAGAKAFWNEHQLIFKSLPYTLA